MDKRKGILKLIRGIEFKVGDQVVEYFSKTGTARLLILFDKTGTKTWETRCGETVHEDDVYKFVIATDTTFYPLKAKQWLSCLQGKTKVGEEVEFELMGDNTFEYARILPKTTHYTEEDIVAAYELAIQDSAKLIKRSKTQILNHFKKR